jgi:transcriptional regulator with XRE-family HTH domain
MRWNDRIKERRLALKLRKVALGKIISVSGPTISDWESGKIQRIEGENLVRVAAALGVTPEWLLFGTGIRHGQEAAEFAAEAAQVYRSTTEEGRLFLRNTLSVVKQSFKPDAGSTSGNSGAIPLPVKKQR